MSLLAERTPVSIRRRMLAALLWTSVVWGLVAPLMVVLTIRHEINELLDDTLRASAEALSGVVQAPAPQTSAVPMPAGGTLIQPAGDYVRGRFAWQLVGSDRAVLLHSPLAPVAPFVADRHTGLSNVDSGWRVLGVPVGEGQMLYVAQSLGERSEALRDAALNTMLASLAVWAVCVFWLLRRMRSELAQIARLVRDVQEHDPMDPAKPLPPVTRAELRPIREAIDDLGAAWPCACAMSAPSPPTPPMRCARRWPAWTPSSRWPCGNARPRSNRACSGSATRPAALPAW